ncbi:glycosyltransferase family 2 protein [Paenibacillus apiarius]|uniref:glycosyltransferase family 2 protein n=1 Tax=Paenibacillus apiarius TaxID=46240 RepID=UPI00398BA428
MEPVFSILVPTYTHGCLLRFALDSILQQTCQQFEVFVICDGAIDEGPFKISNFLIQVSYYRHVHQSSCMPKT